MCTLVLIPHEKESSVSLLLSYLYENQECCVVLPQICVSAVNDRNNVVFININPYWGTISKRSGMTGRKIFTRMLQNVFENMKQFNPLDCPWLLRKGCAWRAQDVVRNSDEQDYKAGISGVVSVPSELLEPGRRGLRTGFTGSHMHFIAFFLSFMCRIFLCALKLFVNYHIFVQQSGDFLGGTV